jgi:hypothetical protein
MDGSRNAGLSHPSQRDVGSGHVALVESVLQLISCVTPSHTVAADPSIGGYRAAHQSRARRIAAALAITQTVG